MLRSGCETRCLSSAGSRWFRSTFSSNAPGGRASKRSAVAAAREFEGVMQRWAIRYRTRHLFGENLFAPRFGQRVALQDKVPVYGRNAGIADQHRFRRDVAGIG